MTKYGRRLRFGYWLLPTAVDPTRPLRLAAQAEMLGLDYVGIQKEANSTASHDPWTLLTAIGMTTTRIALVADGAEMSSRSPAMLARAAASLDLLTGSRVSVALGAGGSGEPATALEEAVRLMRHIWREEPQGAAETALAPAHPIAVWLRGDEPPTLGLAGRIADGWMAEPYPGGQPRDLARWARAVDDAAASAGRAPSEIQRIWPIAGSIGNGGRSKGRGWADSLAELALEVGIDTFLLLESEDAEPQLQHFALEVVPQTRELVEPAAGISPGLARARQGAGASGAIPAEEATGEVDWVDETSMESFPASDPPASGSVA